MKPIRMMLCAAATFALTLLGAHAALAAEIPWRDKPMRYVAVEPKELRSFIREMAAQQGMAVSIDPDVKGEITGRYNLTPGSMMELLARTHALVYYYDGRVLYVAPSTAVESDVIRLSDGSPARFQKMIERLGIADSRYPLTVDYDRNTVMVSGPRRYVELVRQAAKVSEQRPSSSGPPVEPESATRVFNLNFAFAEDYFIRSGGKEYRVLGLVSILRRTYASIGTHFTAAPLQPQAQTLLVEREATGNTPVLPLLRGPRRTMAAPSAEAATSLPVAEQQTINVPSQLPTFSADSRTNSIIVRDIPSRLSTYAEVIRALDLRPTLVELEVNIIEVNSDDFATLGIDWKVLGSEASFEVGSGSVAARATDPRGNTPDPSALLNISRTVGNVQGAVFALLGGNRTQLIARISALERGGRANVRAQPRILTMNNIEAVLESMSTIYAKVEGFQDAQLFDINVGTAVRLTPSVVQTAMDVNRPDELSQLVRMLVRIEDGSITDQVVDRLPVVHRSNIVTQAIVLDGMTLMIAGYSQERTSEVKNAVPVLSEIPLLGNLFKSRSTTRQKTERLFMITPRVVDLSTAGVARAAQPTMGVVR
jgi:type III secretion protein C